LLLLLVSGGERAAACCFAVLAATRGTLLTLWGWVTAGPPLWFARGAAQLLATV